jgi:hypothetical protein
MKIVNQLFLVFSLLIACATKSLAQVPDDINGRLYRLAKVWGLAKYYHPENCQVDWSALLTRAVDSVLVSTTNLAFNETLRDMLLAAGNVPDPGFPLVNTAEINKNAYFTWIADTAYTEEVKDILGDIVEYFRPTANCLVIPNDQTDPNYVGYLSLTYDNLSTFPGFTYTKESHRLLALFYYWNIINYFNPNNDLMDQPWDTTLLQFIPQVREVQTDTAFHVLFLRLVRYIDDTHGFTSSLMIRQYFGNFYPLIGLQPIGNQSVVTKVGEGITGLAVGDIIKKINGIDIAFLLDSLRPFKAASNEAALQRDLHQLVLRSDENATMHVEYEDASGAIQSTSLSSNTVSPDYYDWLYTDAKPIWEITSCGYGYINMGKLTNALVPAVYNALKDAPAIIFDIRNYPNGTLWSLIPKFYTSQRTWALLTVPDLTFPGWYNWYNNRNDAGIFSNPQAYSGKVIILVNAETQSQAEYTVMGLQNHPKAITLGSQTAGADGNISNVILPGDLVTYWSSLGVFYEDTTDTQRVGVHIDSIVVPTIEDIRLGHDRVLHAALDCLTSTDYGLTPSTTIAIYPNPASDITTITWEKPYPDIQLEVTNAIGQVVFTTRVSPSESKQFQIPMTDFTDGVYIVRLINGDSIIAAEKLVKH